MSSRATHVDTAAPLPLPKLLLPNALTPLLADASSDGVPKASLAGAALPVEPKPTKPPPLPKPPAAADSRSPHYFAFSGQ